MKSLINYIRGVHPFIIMLVLFVFTFMFFSTVKPLSQESILAIIVVEAIIMLCSLLAINFLTKGKYSKESKKGWYVGQIGVSYFGERIRWTGYFKYKYTAVFSTMYQAWILDHFSDINSNCGINYYVNEVGYEKY